MRFLRYLVGTFAVSASLVLAVSTGAASITLTPTTAQYGSHPLVRVTGLIPRATYIMQIYDPDFAPLIAGGIQFMADADGSWATAMLSFDQSNRPGKYTFEVATSSGTLITRDAGIIVGTNSYNVQQRLGVTEEIEQVQKTPATAIPAIQPAPPQPTQEPAPQVTSITPASGTTAGGISVTITGNGFQPGVRVIFPSAADDAAACSETSVNAAGTQITCTTPEQIPGTLDIIVMNPDGQMAVLPHGYTYQ